jgi:hypothetical protein
MDNAWFKVFLGLLDRMTHLVELAKLNSYMTNVPPSTKQMLVDGPLFTPPKSTSSEQELHGWAQQPRTLMAQKMTREAKRHH